MAKQSGWVTINGVHVFIDGKSGKITQGPTKFIGRTLNDLPNSSNTKNMDTLTKQEKKYLNATVKDIDNLTNYQIMRGNNIILSLKSQGYKVDENVSKRMEERFLEYTQSNAEKAIKKAKEASKKAKEATAKKKANTKHKYTEIVSGEVTVREYKYDNRVRREYYVKGRHRTASTVKELYPDNPLFKKNTGGKK